MKPLGLGVEGCHETSWFRRILAKSPTQLRFKRDGAGNWNVSSENALGLL